MTSPKQDFYQHVNHDWLDTVEIPNDKPVVNSFSFLADEIEKTLMADVEKMVSGDIPLTTTELKSFVDFYQLASDYEERETIGLAPLVERLRKIETLASLQEWSQNLADWRLSGYSLPFGINVTSDMKQADIYNVYLSVPSLILPDTTYYTDSHPNKEDLLSIYQLMMTNLLQMLGKSTEEAEQIVSNNLAFDASLVPFIKSAEESADYTKAYNPKSLETVASYHEVINFETLLSTLLKQTPEEVIVTEPIFFEALQELLNEETFQLFKDWMICQYVLSFSNRLTEEFRQMSSRYGLALKGIKETMSKEKVAFYMSSGIFDQILGRYYAENYFCKQAKTDVEDMVHEMIQIYQNRLKNNTWLAKETRDKAVLKLNKLGIHVGYPETIPDIYAKFVTIPKEKGGSLISNLEAFRKISLADNFSRYQQKVDRDEWEMSPDTVNAYYHPQKNVIVFPAAILQAPFYDIHQSRSANYGGIGAVIAHEISHAFDNNGAKFDEIGNLNNWWTDEDLAHFETLTQQMIEQFDGIPFGNSHANGTLTVSENIADAGGLSCALEAAQLEETYNGADLFENWARIWRNKSQEQYTDLLLAIDVHAPAKLRANIQPKNLDEFYQIYDITPQDDMYLAPEKRIHIW